MARGMEELKGSLAKLHSSAEHSDFTIVCGDRTFRVHKAIISARSTYFEAACREGTFKEGKEGTLVLPASSEELGHDNAGTDDPEAIGHLIHFLYNGYYDFATKTRGDTQVHKDNRSLSLPAKVYAAATKYDIGALQQLAYAHYYASHWTLQTGAYPMPVEDLAEAIRIVYVCDLPAYKRMQDITSETLVRHKALLRDPLISAAIESVEGAAYRLLLYTQELLFEYAENEPVMDQFVNLK